MLITAANLFAKKSTKDLLVIVYDWGRKLEVSEWSFPGLGIKDMFADNISSGKWPLLCKVLASDVKNSDRGSYKLVKSTLPQVVMPQIWTLSYKNYSMGNQNIKVTNNILRVKICNHNSNLELTRNTIYFPFNHSCIA